MSIKYADEIIREIEKRGQIQIPDSYVTGEEFEKWLRDKNIGFIKEEITKDCNCNSKYKLEK